MSVITRAIKSSLDASTDALKAAEEALAAAKIANINAKAAYDAFCVSGYIPPFTIEAEGHKKKEEKCANCKQSVCLHGKPLTESLIKNPVGLRIMTHGDSWKEEQKKMIGTVQSINKSTGNSFLMVLWDSKNTLEQFTILSKMSSKFIVYCKTQKLKNPPIVTPEKCDTLISSSKNLNDAKCSNCKRKKCVNGTFLTTFNNNNIGLSVKHVDFHKDKVGKIANFDDGFVIRIKWDGSNKVKRYMFLKTDDNDKAQLQFRFVCKSSDDSKEAIEEKETKPVDTSTEEFF